MTDSPQPPPAELLTLPEAAVLTGLSVKALTRRIERGTLPSERHQGRRLLRRGELQRLRNEPSEIPGEGGAGEIAVWRDLYEREREQRDQLATRNTELERQLAAIVNAGPIRAMRLRRAARSG